MALSDAAESRFVLPRTKLTGRHINKDRVNALSGRGSQAIPSADLPAARGLQLDPVGGVLVAGA